MAELIQELKTANDNIAESDGKLHTRLNSVEKFE